MWSSYQKSIINTEDEHVGRAAVLQQKETKLMRGLYVWADTSVHFATGSEDLRSHSLPLCRNIEEFPHKLWLCPRSYSLSSGVDNIHRCLPGFIIHFHHCNLRIFPLQGLQQQLIVLSPGQMHFSILCIIHDIISEIEFLLADITWRRRVLLMVLVWGNMGRKQR